MIIVFINSPPIVSTHPIQHLLGSKKRNLLFEFQFATALLPKQGLKLKIDLSIRSSINASAIRANKLEQTAAIFLSGNALNYHHRQMRVLCGNAKKNSPQS